MPVRRRTLLAAALLVATACGAPRGSSTNAPEADASSPGAPSPLIPAGISVRILGDDPVLAGVDVDDDWLLPGALTFVDGTYHLWGVAFAQETEENHGFYATSSDGLVWTVASEDPLATLGLDLSYPGALPGSVLHEPDGTWEMYAWGTPVPMLRGSVLYRATAPAPAGPWTAAPDPILTGTMGAWDASFLDFPSVIATEEGWLMLYSGGTFTSPDTSAIGLATSPDGLSWTKLPDPVIEPGLCGEFDTRSVAMPRLRFGNEGLLALFVALDERTTVPAVVGAATSVDGRSWTCATPVPALTGEDIPDSHGIHSFAVAAEAAGPEVIVESLGERFSSLWLGDVDMSSLE